MFLCYGLNNNNKSSKKSKKIDKETRQHKLKQDEICKILLLGPGDAGKSTFLKQLNLLHNTENTEIKTRVL